MTEGDWRDHWPPEQPVVAPEFQLDPGDAALLIVDMQYGSADPDYGLGAILRRDYPDAADYYYTRVEESIVPGIKRLLATFRERDLRVIYLTIASNLADGSDFPKLRSGSEQRVRQERGLGTSVTAVGKPEQRILEDLEPLPNDLVLNKVTRSAFHSTGLDALLRNMGINTLVITGVGTNACVAATAIDAADIGYRRNPEKKRELMLRAAEFQDRELAEQLVRFLEDDNETIRFLAVDAVMAQDEDDLAEEPLRERLRVEDSLRVVQKITDIFVDNPGWTIPEEDREEVEVGLPDGFGVHKKGHIYRKRR